MSGDNVVDLMAALEASVAAARAVRRSLEPPTPDVEGFATAVAAVEAIGASAEDPEHDVEDLAAMLRALEDIKRRADIAADDVRKALLAHVRWRRPVSTAYGRLKRDWKGRRDVWDHRATAYRVAAAGIGLNPDSSPLPTVVADAIDAVLKAGQFGGWRKGVLRDEFHIEPGEEPDDPAEGVEYLGLCEREGGRETVVFETTRKPDSAPEE